MANCLFLKRVHECPCRLSLAVQHQSVCIGDPASSMAGFVTSANYSVLAPVSEWGASAAWFGYPPPNADLPRRSTCSTSTKDWLRSTYPTLSESSKPLECTLEAGDAILVPPGWRKSPLALQVLVLRSCLPSEATIVVHVLMYGRLGDPPKQGRSNIHHIGRNTMWAPPRNEPCWR